MTLQRGWINRQFARVEREAKSWPEWMSSEDSDQKPSSSEIVCDSESNKKSTEKKTETQEQWASAAK